MLATALQGIRVLDLTRLYPGPLCTLMLGDLGADVIKIESPQGEMGRYMPPVKGAEGATFAQLNRNKRSLTLNLKNEQAVLILKRLLRDADVLVESFRPAVMKRFGLDYDSLVSDFPRLIYCSITGFGQNGLAAQRPAHDLNYISLAGILSGSDQMCLVPTIQIADTVGGFQAAAAILAALFERSRSGCGQYLDVSLLDGAFFTMILLAGMHVAGTSESPLSGNLACYRVYKTADGKYLAVAVLEPKFWSNFCKKLDLPHFREKQFQNDQNELIDIISQKIATRTLKDWVEYWSSDDVCVTPVYSVSEAMQSQYVSHRNLLLNNTTMRTPFVLEASNNRSAPQLGEHNHEILEDAGYNPAEIEEFARSGVI
jgi:alpha-methylacyl-CoA racemase